MADISCMVRSPVSRRIRFCWPASVGCRHRSFPSDEILSPGIIVGRRVSSIRHRQAYSPQYASIASAVLLGGLWFQLHVSPQSLELVLYLGIILLLVKIIDDEPRRKLWTTLAILSAPIFVASHPETPLAISLGMAGFRSEERRV